jgi:hypothetical protein
LTLDFHRELAQVEDLSRVVWDRSGCWGFVLSGFGFGGTALEADAVVVGLEDMAMMGKAVVVILASPNTPAHALKLRLVVMMTLVRS